MPDDVTDRIKELAADLLEVPLGEIDESTGQGSPETWDSLLTLNLVVAIEDEFGLHFAPDEIEKMTTIRSISDLVRAST